MSHYGYEFLFFSHFFQMEEDFMEEWELKTVLATLALYSSYSCNRLNTVYDGYFDSRAIQISVTFSRTYSLVFSMLATCGYPVPLTKVRICLSEF